MTKQHDRNNRYQTYESETPETHRHEHLQRSLCGTTAGTAGRAGTHYTGVIGEDGHTTVDVRCVGTGKSTADNYRTSPGTCESPENYAPKTATEKVENGQFLFASETDFCEKNRKNPEKYSIFLCDGHVMGKISLIFAKKPDYPVDIHRKLCYNRGIPIGNSPIKTGLESARHTRKPLTANLTKLDSLLSLTISRVDILTSGLSQPTKGATL